MKYCFLVAVTTNMTRNIQKSVSERICQKSSYILAPHPMADENENFTGVF